MKGEQTRISQDHGGINKTDILVAQWEGQVLVACVSDLYGLECIKKRTSCPHQLCHGPQSCGKDVGEKWPR